MENTSQKRRWFLSFLSKVTKDLLVALALKYLLS
jgi:hypothetical protein